MRIICGHAIILTFVIVAVSPVSAQDRQPPPDERAAALDAAPPATAPSTGKERLSNKWMDEQRMDNCKVPLDKRGAKPRPDACADGPASR
jgi:hypothetical protein